MEVGNIPAEVSEFLVNSLKSHYLECVYLLLSGKTSVVESGRSEGLNSSAMVGEKGKEPE